MIWLYKNLGREGNGTERKGRDTRREKREEKTTANNNSLIPYFVEGATCIFTDFLI